MKKLFLAAPLALAAGGLLATPASAASWNSAGQFRAQIAQLDRQVDNARGLSRSEERRLENQVDNLQSLYQRYARNGINRAEASVLSTRIAQVRNQLFRQSNDRNGHNDWNGRGGHHDGRGHR